MKKTPKEAIKFVIISLTHEASEGRHWVFVIISVLGGFISDALTEDMDTFDTFVIDETYNTTLKKFKI